MLNALNRRHILKGGTFLSLGPSLLKAACIDTPISAFDDDSTAEEVTVERHRAVVRHGALVRHRTLERWRDLG